MFCNWRRGRLFFMIMSECACVLHVALGRVYALCWLDTVTHNMYQMIDMSIDILGDDVIADAVGGRGRDVVGRARTVALSYRSELSTLSHSHLYNHGQQSLRYVEHPYNFNIANKTIKMTSGKLINAHLFSNLTRWAPYHDLVITMGPSSSHLFASCRIAGATAKS